MIKEINKDQQELGRRLKEIREKRRLTQANVAKNAGININYYARIERGKENPSFEVLKRLASALKVKSGDFLPF